MKTQGEIEAAVCHGITSFEQEYIQTHLFGDLLIVRLCGVLTAAEQQLVKTLIPEKAEICSNKSAPNWLNLPGRFWPRWFKLPPASKS